MSWKSEAAKLKAWLSPQRGLTGARDFLLERMGVRTAQKWTPGQAFGLELREPQMNGAPLSEEQGADPRGWD
jgi:hypothetical protein